MIEYFRRLPFVQPTMRWDGTADAADAIKAWVGTVPGADNPAFLTPEEAAGAFHEVTSAARLWVAHSGLYIPLEVSWRVVAELDRSGFYPLSPTGLAHGFETFPVVCTCGRLTELHPQAAMTRSGACPVHDAPKVPKQRPPAES